MSLKHRYAKKYLSNSIRNKCEVALPSYQTPKIERSSGFPNRKGPTRARSSFTEGAAGVARSPEHPHG